MMRGRKAVAIGFAVIALGWGRPALAIGIPDMVALGSDYFQTQPGTSFNFGPGIGVVPFVGNPIGPGNTDTIVQRQADAVIGGGPMPIQLTALSLKSASPVNIGGSFFDVFVTLNPAELGRDVGSITINGSLAGGTFSSDLNVFFDAHFQPETVGKAFDVLGSTDLLNPGATWGPAPPPGALLVPGPDCDPGAVAVCTPGQVAADQAANLHSGLASNEVDFFVVGSLTQDSSDGAAHNVVAPAGVPEPGSLLLLGSGLAGFLGAVTRKKWR